MNDKSITYYEISQRETLLKALKAPGNPVEVARTQLIEDRLKLSVAEDLDVLPTEEEILAGMDEFSARARMDTTAFLQELSRIGIDEQSFRDFIIAGIAWRNAIQSKFGARSQVSELQLERTVNASLEVADIVDRNHITSRARSGGRGAETCSKVIEDTFTDSYYRGGEKIVGGANTNAWWACKVAKF